MPSTFSPSLRIELIGDGEQSGIWGNTTNNNLGGLLEQSITGTTNLDVTAGDITLTSLNGLVDQARSAVLAVTGTPGVTRVLTIPNVYKNYTVQNATANIVQVKTASGAAFSCPPTSHSYINCNAANVVTGRSITTQANALTSSNDLATTVQSLGIAPINSPAFTGIPTAPTAAPGTSTTQLATTAFVSTAVAAGIPVGLISMWSGSIGAIPSGWALCDGTSGRPDLRDRFIVGAGSTYAIGATGGSNTVTLDTTQIPSHTHTGSGTSGSTDLSHTHTGSGNTGNNSVDHSHTGSGTTSAVSNDHSHSGTTAGVGDHAHGYTTIISGASDAGGDVFGQQLGAATTAGAGAHSHSFSTGGQSANHTHTYSFTTSGQNTAHTHAFSFTTDGASVSMAHTHSFSFTTAGTGGGGAHENRPPYFALAYIIKV